MKSDQIVCFTIVTLEKIVLIGFVPVTFPGDPIDVNFVEEHTILGQILEPLFEPNAHVGYWH